MRRKEGEDDVPLFEAILEKNKVKASSKSGSKSTPKSTAQAATRN
jgi:hypothetical protein